MQINTHNVNTAEAADRPLVSAADKIEAVCVQTKLIQEELFAVLRCIGNLAPAVDDRTVLQYLDSRGSEQATAAWLLRSGDRNAGLLLDFGEFPGRNGFSACDESAILASQVLCYR